MHTLLSAIFYLTLSVQNCIASSQTDKVQAYGLKDLEVLEQGQEYKEFFTHAKDILPSGRTKIWKNMVKSMAMQMLSPMKNLTTPIAENDFKLINKISTWSVLKNDEFFQKQKDEVMVRHFTNCFKAKEYKVCHENALRYINNHSVSLEFGVNLIKNLYDHLPEDKSFLIQSEKFGMWPFVKELVKSELSEFYCDKVPLKDIIINHLFSHIYKIQLGNESSDKFSIEDIIHKDCWSGVKNDVKKAIMTSEDSKFRANALKAFEDKMLLTSDEVYLYTLLQLLSGNKINARNIITYWKRLRELGQNYSLRIKLFEKLKKQIPLAGKVFWGQTKQQKHIVKGLNQYFPEYIDYYATTCIEHLSGEKQTPGGNPATRCHEFFALSSLLKLLPAGKQIQYTQMMKF